MRDLGPFWLSLRVASLATFLIVAVGLPISLTLAQVRFPGKGLLSGILVLPLVLPPTVLGYYLLQILGRRSPVGYWLEQTMGVTLVFHWSGAVIASAVAAFPLFLLPARGGIRGGRPGPGRCGPAPGAKRVVCPGGGDTPLGLAADWPRGSSWLSRGP